MFKNSPKILAHHSAVSVENFATPEYIIHKSDSGVKLLNRFCPHRMYPLAQPGNIINQITCKFHGFAWSKDGKPINNDKNIYCGTANIVSSGLITKNFIEPNHRWVTDLANETNLKYSHSMEGSSKGSWLWMMEIQADLLHIRQGNDVIHPTLASVTNLEQVIMEQGDGWILQTCSTGWWLFVYPYTFVEWSPGCLSINYTTPHNTDNEFGFDWITQFYYNPDVSEEKRKEFETLEDVFKEDVNAIELQKGKWFPIKHPYNQLENHCVHFGKWVLKNRT